MWSAPSQIHQPSDVATGRYEVAAGTGGDGSDVRIAAGSDGGGERGHRRRAPGLGTVDGRFGRDSLGAALSDFSAKVRLQYE
jgi:hypothetical protein